MPEFHPAWRAQVGHGPRHDRVQLADVDHLPTFKLSLRHSAESSLNEVEGLVVQWQNHDLTLHSEASFGFLQYFRLADGTLIPLPPEHDSARHKLVPDKVPGGLLKFAAGDAYVAVSPGACRVTDSPAIARFLHLRDYFNAEKLAGALLAHIVEVAGADQLPEDVTVLVVEAR